MTDEEQIAGFPDALGSLCREAHGVRLSLWWLGCDCWNPRLRFLYGFAIPSRQRDADKWVHQDVLDHLHLLANYEWDSRAL